MEAYSITNIIMYSCYVEIQLSLRNPSVERSGKTIASNRHEDDHSDKSIYTKTRSPE